METPLFGNFRSKVIDNKDPEMFGRVKVWIPDIMPEVEDTKGLWARPANNPVGGRNLEGDKEHHYMGSSYIPKIGSWVWIFFEVGNVNRPYYFGALDLENTKVLPENQTGTNYEDKWTVLRTAAGRVIHISDDPDDERIEITGKKRDLDADPEPPTGDEASVWKIDDNMTTILFDERVGKEKILIRTVKGDFLHIDIDERKLQAYFKDDIHIQTDKDLYIKVAGKMHTHVGQDIFEQCGNNRHQKVGGTNSEEAGIDSNIKSGSNFNNQAGTDINQKSGANTNNDSGADTNILAGGNILTDGATRLDQTGAAGPAGPAAPPTPATPATPKGERDT